MLCPSCNSGDTRVLRKTGTMRRRECVDCRRRWSTDERPVDELREAKGLRRRLAAAERAEAMLRRQLLEIAGTAKRAAG